MWSSRIGLAVSFGNADCAPTARAAARRRFHRAMSEVPSRGIRIPPFSATKSSRIIARSSLACCRAYGFEPRRPVA